ncbi:uncharacterized protein C20orf96 homolog isoform X2 [Pteropus alecto]|uniref:uncharacterized protein C20orf96 homolog isoform X2 n=1 Tax=Pteropus alecto TaxID=9402 RepID=UPI000D5368F6|nr:uncharacterized protein C20orf96 homolog isoform X2 [Pteropus alecto]
MWLEFRGEAEDVNLGSIWVEMASKVTRNWKGARGISSLSDSRSTIHKFQSLGYVPEQRSKQKIRPSTLLPVLQTSGLKKSKAKTLTSIQPEYSKPTMLMTSQLKNLQELHRAKSDSGKMQANIRLMRKMLRNRQTSLQELRNHEDFITKLNQKLIKNIQDMEDSSTLKVRALLQQQDILGVRLYCGPEAPPLRLGPAHCATLLTLARSPGPSLRVAEQLLPSGRYILHTLRHLPGLCNQTKMGSSSQCLHLLARRL